MDAKNSYCLNCKAINNIGSEFCSECRTNLIAPLLAKISQVQNEAEQRLKEVFAPINDIGQLYLIWKADKENKFPLYISDQLKAIYPTDIPPDATANFFIKVAKSRRYLLIRWIEKSKADKDRVEKQMTIGALAGD